MLYQCRKSTQKYFFLQEIFGANRNKTFFGEFPFFKKNPKIWKGRCLHPARPWWEFIIVRAMRSFLLHFAYEKLKALAENCHLDFQSVEILFP